MELLAIEPAKLLVLMAAGGIFSLAGLWLMFRKPEEGEAAKIELFGLKFQSSSAGLLVFLIGAVFLVLPLFVPERVSQDIKGDLGANDGSVSGATVGGGQQGVAAVVLPAAADATEKEPNNRSSEANQVVSGIYYAGKTDSDRNDDVDWFVVARPDGAGPDVEVQLRSMPGTMSFCSYFVLDENEVQVTYSRFANVGSSNSKKAFLNDVKHMFVSIRNDTDWPCHYELRVMWP